MTISPELLAKHHVVVPSDNAFQQRARLRQALWRERMGIPIGEHRGRPLGSRIAMPFAKESLANYLTAGIREVVHREVVEAGPRSEKLYQEPRIWDDLLSSQPLCFNLFGELARDLNLASRTFAALLTVTGLRVTSVLFEHSPGRGDPRFTADWSAFDVFVTYEAPLAERGFVGIEVKYVEDLRATPARHRRRYDEVADAMGVFRDDARQKLREPPLEQFWRDHLLAGSMLLGEPNMTTGMFAVLYPSENEPVATGVRAYRECLKDNETFKAWTLEQVLGAIVAAGTGAWVEELRARYLGGTANGFRATLNAQPAASKRATGCAAHDAYALDSEGDDDG